MGIVILTTPRHAEAAASPLRRSPLWEHAPGTLLLVCLALPACGRAVAEPDAKVEPALPPVHSAGTSLASALADARAPQIKPGTRLALSEHCSNICGRSAPLDCVGKSECQSFCEELATSLACHEQMTAVLDCFAEQPTDDWECSEQGLPALKEGHCSAEQAGYRSCREKSDP